MTTRKRTVTGIADQVVSSGTNFFVAFLAARLLDPSTFGGFVVAFSVVIISVAVGRALVGEPLLSEVSTHTGERRRRLVTDAVTAALVLGLGAGGLGVVLGVGLPVLGVDLFSVLVWLAPWLPAVLVQDAARHAHLSARQPGSALLLDSVWGVIQLVTSVLVVVVGAAHVGALAATWGLGALGGAVVFLLRERCVPWSGRPRAWLVSHRHIGGWRTGTVLVGQMQQQGVLVLAGAVMAPTVVAGLRAVQLIIAQPVQTLVTALLGLLVPSAARLRAAGELSRLRSRTRGLGRWFVAGGLLVFLVVPLREPILAVLLPAYVDDAELVLPVAAVAFLTCANAPHQATLRGMQAMRPLFWNQVVALVVASVGVVGGAVVGSALALAWGIAGGAAVLTVGNAWQAARALRAERPTESPDPVEEPEPEPVRHTDNGRPLPRQDDDQDEPEDDDGDHDGRADDGTATTITTITTPGTTPAAGPARR